MFSKDLLIKIMEDKNFSAYKLWKVSNVAQSTISTILSGENKNPTTATLEKLASALDVSISAFFKNEESLAKQNSTTKNNKDSVNPRLKPIIDSLDRAGDLKDEDINEISEQVEFLINLKRKKRESSK